VKYKYPTKFARLNRKTVFYQGKDKLNQWQEVQYTNLTNTNWGKNIVGFVLKKERTAPEVKAAQ
jgi:hypothetical protein